MRSRFRGRLVGAAWLGVPAAPPIDDSNFLAADDEGGGEDPLVTDDEGAGEEQITVDEEI